MKQYTCQCGNVRTLKTPPKGDKCRECTSNGRKCFDWKGRKVSSPELFRIGVFPSPRTAQILWNTYSLSPERFFEILEFQNGKCPVFDKTIDLQYRCFSVDHCHDTGMVRGILSPRANTAIGNFQDNPTYLLSAVDYLQKGDTLHAIDFKLKRPRQKRTKRTNNLWHSFRILPETVDRWINNRQNRCDICRNEMWRPCIDHCHIKSVVRGVLCPKCNAGLGLLNDCPIAAKRAAEYLES